jgi:hypothetical protein
MPPYQNFIGIFFIKNRELDFFTSTKDLTLICMPSMHGLQLSLYFETIVTKGRKIQLKIVQNIPLIKRERPCNSFEAFTNISSFWRTSITDQCTNSTDRKTTQKNTQIIDQSL